MLESNYECHGRDVQVDQLLIALLRSDGSVQVTEVPALPELVRRALEHLCTDLEASSSSSTASSSWPRRSSSSSSWTHNGNITLQSFRAASLRPHPITVERSEVTHTCHDGPDSREVRVVTLKVTDKANLNQSGVDLGPHAAAVTASGVATLGGPKGGEEAKSATATATAEDTSHSLRAVTFSQPQKGQLPLAPPQTAAAKGKPFQAVTVTTPRRSQTCADPPPPPSPPPAPPPPSPPRRRPRGSSFTSDLNLRPTKLALHSPE